MAETPKRIDPTSKRVDGSIDDRIVGKREDRHYILANPNDEDCGAPAMEALGYEVVLHSKDGPRVRGSRSAAVGSAVTVRGQVLMSCPMEEFLARYWEGQKRADAQMTAIRQAGGIDSLRNTSNGAPVSVAQNIEEFETVRS